ncbi:glycoside hydrolase family 16 protein [Variovorax sp. LT1P1]|uniref:glycoside hydrolase family 16 protein n=1 Tax=Variovorax sp. LT1P1 TaxID=3443730 RepID=UPI003F45A451
MAQASFTPAPLRRAFMLAGALLALASAAATQERGTGRRIVAIDAPGRSYADWREEQRPLPPREANGASSSAQGYVWVQTLDPGQLEPGESYVLRLRADPGSAPGSVSVIFRYPQGNESFRTYRAGWDGETSMADVELSFVAPAFSRMVEVQLAKRGPEDLDLRAIALRKRSTPIVQTEPVRGNEASFVPRGYRLVFNDEFDGAALNRSKWFTRGMNANESIDHLKDEEQRYRDNHNHVVSSGRLHLVARRTGEGAYESGMIRSDWTVRYGYFEARVKMPAGRGVFPAFWLSPDVGADGSQGWPPELDIFEYVNNGVEDTSDMVHTGVIDRPGTTSPFVYADPMFNRQWSYWKAPFAFDRSWHTIGAEWTEDSFSTFVDGKKIVERSYRWQFADGRLASKAHVILNLAIGGAWAGRHGIEDSKFPASFEIDWVRVYQLPQATIDRAGPQK